jgi:hypothetical protein
LSVSSTIFVSSIVSELNFTLLREQKEKQHQTHVTNARHLSKL